MNQVDLGSPIVVAPPGSVRPYSAKALLLVMLGEFVWPQAQPVWSSTLLAALAELDVEPNAARKAVTRTAESGMIVATREGRRVRWSITPRGHEILAAGYQRTYGWDARDRTWDGRWLMLSVTVPESQRNIRHRLQNRLAWAGLGSPVPGQWLTSHWERGTEIAAVVTGLGLGEQSHAMVGTVGPLGDERRLVEAAWDVDALAADYEAFVAAFAGMRPGGDRDCLRARIEMVQEWRRFPYVDPDLPRRFLPRRWPGDEAARVFRDRHNAWEVRSARHWIRMTSSG